FLGSFEFMLVDNNGDVVGLDSEGRLPNTSLDFVGGGGGGGGPANNMAQKQRNAIKKCVQQLYNIDTRNFVPIAQGSNGYFYGLDANGNGITVETNVTHSSWYLGLAFFPPSGPVGGRTPLSTAPSQMNYVANDPAFMAEGLIQPNQ